jgi:hypothetical protein
MLVFGKYPAHAICRYLNGFSGAKMNQRVEVVQTELSDGTVIRVQARIMDEEQEVAFTLPSFAGVRRAVESISKEMQSAVTAVCPSKATVEMSFEFAMESGELTALLMAGSSKASLKITLEWSQANSKS